MLLKQIDNNHLYVFILIYSIQFLFSCLYYCFHSIFRWKYCKKEIRKWNFPLHVLFSVSFFFVSLYRSYNFHLFCSLNYLVRKYSGMFGMDGNWEWDKRGTNIILFYAFILHRQTSEGLHFT